MYPEFAAVILSAGSSRRMGRPKALLEIEGDRFINRILKNLAGLQLRDILIILGEHAGLIGPALTGQVKVHILQNPNPAAGQLSSVKIALRNIDPAVRGMLIILVDHPLVRRDTYRQILDAALPDPDRIILPNCNGHNGHPVYFGRSFFPSLELAPMEEGARYVVRNNRAQVMILPVEDEGILQDIDDPDAYRKIIAGGQ